MADTDDTAPTRAAANGAAGATTSSAAARTRRAPAANARRRVSRAAAVDADTIEAQVAELQRDIRSITSTLGRMGQTAGNELKSTAQAQADDLTARGQSALSYAQDEFGAFEKQIKDTIREKPLTAVAGAIALGFVLAVITR